MIKVIYKRNDILYCILMWCTYMCCPVGAVDNHFPYMCGAHMFCPVGAVDNCFPYICGAHICFVQLEQWIIISHTFVVHIYVLSSWSSG